MPEVWLIFADRPYVRESLEDARRFARSVRRQTDSAPPIIRYIPSHEPPHPEPREASGGVAKSANGGRMTWNHRVIEYRDPDGSVWRMIHEVHYDDAGLPVAYTERGAEVVGEDEAEMRRTLERMLACLDKPVLVEADFQWEQRSTAPSAAETPGANGK